jgi:S-adenosylmethionine hydrolase
VAAVAPPFVTFLSDFGTSDDFAGTCHGVINLICPDAQVIHVTHGIQPQAIGQGARVLAGAIRYLPPGVHLAVVDPGVGSERRAAPDHHLEGTRLYASVQHVDRFGNIQLAVSAGELHGLFRLGGVAEIDTGDDRYYARCADTFADVGAGEFVLYEDSVGLLSFALNQGSAAELTAIEFGAQVIVDLAPNVTGEST